MGAITYGVVAVAAVLAERLALLRYGAERFTVDRFAVVAAGRVHFDGGRFAAAALTRHGCT